MKKTGVVEAVGNKFNGSLKIDGAWLNYKKGVKSAAKVGDNVTLTLQEWEFNGKSGVNIIAVDIIADAPAPKAEAPKEAVKPSAAVSAPKPTPVGRDFEKEARGKTLCQYIQAQLSNPGVDVNDTDGIIERAKILRDATFED